MLNVSWDKTPENIFYKAIAETEAELPDGVELIDYTAMESSVWEQATGKLKHFIITLLRNHTITGLVLVLVKITFYVL